MSERTRPEPDAATASDEEAEPSWAPEDMAAVLDGADEPTPVVLRRADGVCLFYAGKVHSVHGESESGKSWLVQCAAAEVLKDGGNVAYFDFEDDAKSVGGRMLLLGVPKEVVTDPKRFIYVHPETSLKSDAERAQFEGTLARRYDFAVVDGVTDSMGLFGYKVKDNDDIAAWHRDIPKALARRTGAAVACVDHVSRDVEGRGRFALGGQHKIAGLSGAAFVVEVLSPFGRAMAGTVRVRVGKDRPGHLRAHGGKWRKSDRTQAIADLHLDSTGDELIWHVSAPVDAGSASEIEVGGRIKSSIGRWAWGEDGNDPANGSHNETVRRIVADSPGTGVKDLLVMLRKETNISTRTTLTEMVTRARVDGVVHYHPKGQAKLYFEGAAPCDSCPPDS